MVDDYSTDSTETICRDFPNVRFVKRAFDNFGQQKNHAISLASNDWVFSIDADEEVTPELRDEILKALSTNRECSGYYMRLEHAWFGRTESDGYPGGLRIFRKSRGVFAGKHVHEKVRVSGKTCQLESFLKHRSRSFEGFIDHCRIYGIKYGRLAAEDYLFSGERITFVNFFWKIFLVPLLIFFREYILKKKILRGKGGLYVSISSAICYHVAYCHLITLQRAKDRQPRQVPSEEYTSEYFLHCRGGSDEFIKSRGKELCDSHKFALSLANLKPEYDVLDFGCGCGEISLNAALTARSVLGLDYSKDAVALACEARESFPKDAASRTVFKQADIETIPLSSSHYDVVLYIDVIEHLDRSRIDPVMLRLYQSLKKGGRIVIHTWPNRWHRQFTYPIAAALAALTGKYRPWNPRKHFEEVMHVAEQSPFELWRHIKKAGFRNIKVFTRHPVPMGNLFSERIYWALHALPPFRWLFCDNIWGVAEK